MPSVSLCLLCTHIVRARTGRFRVGRRYVGRNPTTAAAHLVATAAAAQRRCAAVSVAQQRTAGRVTRRGRIALVDAASAGSAATAHRFQRVWRFE